MFIAELFDRKLAHRDGIDLEVRSNNTDISIYAYGQGGRELAHVHFDVMPYVSDEERKKIIVPYDLEVGEDYRGQGIAAIMYDYAKELGYEVQRSYEQTDAGAHFWDKNRGPGSKVWEADEKILDPELYEELPNAFLKRIVQNALPGAPLKFRNTPEGYLSVRADDGSVKLDIGMGIHAGDIGFHIENAYLTKHQGQGAMTKIISDAYQAVERKYGKPQTRSLNIMQDRSHGAWQAIANKLGAEYYANSQIDEISADRLERYLAHADKHVSNRMDRMSQARQRLSKSYEIYHADRPAGSAQIVDRFEADTPEQARQYYEKFIQNYDSDVDFDLRLRKGTGIIEEARLPDEVEDFLYDLMPDDVGVEEIGPYRIHYEGFTDDCQSSEDYCNNPEAVYQQVFADHIAREGGRKPVEQNFTGDEDYPILYSVFRIPRQVKEVTTVPTVAKGKRAHLDVMPNGGKPIPQGEESTHMGSKIGQLGGVEVWTYNQGPMRTFVVFDPATRTSQLAVTGSSYPNNADSLIIKGVYSGPKNETRAANLYAWLINKLGLTLVSDIKQSEGGYRVWQELERRFGRYINIHGFNTKTNEPVNIGTQDEPDTHVKQQHLPGATQDVKDIAKNVRLVASPR